LRSNLTNDRQDNGRLYADQNHFRGARDFEIVCRHRDAGFALNGPP